MPNTQTAYAASEESDGDGASTRERKDTALPASSGNEPSPLGEPTSQARGHSGLAFRTICAAIGQWLKRMFRRKPKAIIPRSEAEWLELETGSSPDEGEA